MAMPASLCRSPPSTVRAGPRPRSISRDDRASPVEPVIHADAEDLLAWRDVGVPGIARREWNGGGDERRGIVETIEPQVKILRLYRPVVGNRPFDPAAHDSAELGGRAGADMERAIVDGGSRHRWETR